MSLLSVRGLSKAFGGIQAVAGIGFEVAAGETVALIGPNGAGKTTCFNMLGGQMCPDRGSICLEGRELAGLLPREIWRLGVGRTFQIPATFSSMTVRENVQMALISYHRRTLGMWPWMADLYAEEAMALIERVGMADQAERACGVLTYGDLKRIELAIGLANAPRLLLMDEPTAGMAPRERISLMQLTAEIVRAHGVSVLFTEHDMDVVFSQADRILVLDRGELIADGPPARVRENSRVRDIYLGRAAMIS